MKFDVCWCQAFFLYGLSAHVSYVLCTCKHLFSLCIYRPITHFFYNCVLHSLEPIIIFVFCTNHLFYLYDLKRVIIRSNIVFWFVFFSLYIYIYLENTLFCHPIQSLRAKHDLLCHLYYIKFIWFVFFEGETR